MRPPLPYPVLPWPEAPRHSPQAHRALTWRSRCPHGRVGDWTATPTDDHLRIVTTCECLCEEAS